MKITEKVCEGIVNAVVNDRFPNGWMDDVEKALTIEAGNAIMDNSGLHLTENDIDVLESYNTLLVCGMSPIPSWDYPNAIWKTYEAIRDETLFCQWGGLFEAQAEFKKWRIRVPIMRDVGRRLVMYEKPWYDYKGLAEALRAYRRKALAKECLGVAIWNMTIGYTTTRALVKAFPMMGQFVPVDEGKGKIVRNSDGMKESDNEGLARLLLDVPSGADADAFTSVFVEKEKNG